MADRREEELAQALERELLRRGYSRRDFVKIASAMGFSAVLAACGAEQRPQTNEGQSAAAGTVPATTTGPVTGGVVDVEATPREAFAEARGDLGEYSASGIDEPTSKVTISVAHAWDASFWPRQQAFDRQFMKRHPNIEVKAENTPWGDFLQKYVAQGAGGTLPDLMYVHFSWAQQLIGLGALASLDQYIDGAPDFNLEDFTKPSLVSYTHDGKLYGIPYDEGPGILFYNKELFDKAGVKYPSDDWTLSDLKETAIKLTSGSGPNKIFGLGSTPSPGDATMAPAYLYPFGAKYVSEPNEDECLLDQPEAVEALQWWMELRSKHQVVPSPADLETLTWPAFQFGRIAMQLEGTWATPPINENAKFKWDVAKWPKGPKAQSTFSAGSSYAITENSKSRDAAWIYLNEYISTPGQIFMWASSGRGSPSRNSAWPAYLESKYSPPSAKVAQESLNEFASHDILDTPVAPQVVQKAGAIWDRVITGKLDIKQAVGQICREIEPLLAKNQQ